MDFLKITPYNGSVSHLMRLNTLGGFPIKTKPHLIGNFHKLAQIYFIVLLKTSPTYKGVDPPLAPPPTLSNKHVL